MPKLINVAGKIKDTRKRLGLTQKDFILEVSKKLNLRNPLNESLASQWESNLKNRANPTDEQLAAIAELTSQPWATMWWFMRDDIDHKRGYELYPDGNFTLAPPDLTAEQEEELFAAMATEDKERYSKPINNKLLAWRTEPSTMWSLYEPPDPSASSAQQRALGIAGLLPASACKSCGYKNPDQINFCANCGNATQTEGIGGLLSRKAAAIGGGFYEPELSSIGDSKAVIDPAFLTSAEIESGVNKLASQRANKNSSGFWVSRGPVVGDFVDFPKSPTAHVQTGEFDFEDESQRERRNNFWSAVKFFASNDYFLSTDSFNQKIQTGAISQTVSYFDGDRAVQVITINRDTEITTLRRSLQTRMMELCFIDRMKKRTSKKLILVSTYEKGLKLDTLDKRLEELINSSELLGVQVRFASGPLEVAESITAFRTQQTLTD